MHTHIGEFDITVVPEFVWWGHAPHHIRHFHQVGHLIPSETRQIIATLKCGTLDQSPHHFGIWNCISCVDISKSNSVNIACNCTSWTRHCLLFTIWRQKKILLLNQLKFPGPVISPHSDLQHYN